MGTPKALLPYGGQAFLKHLTDITRALATPRPGEAARIGCTRVVLGAHAAEIQSSLALDASDIVINSQWEDGQLSSIHAAIRSLPEKTHGMILFLVDHPLISAPLVASLIGHFYSTGAPVVIPTFNGKRGHPVIFSADLYPELLAAPSEIGARSVVWAHAAEIAEVPTDEEGILLNLNEPETLRRLLT